MREVSEKTRLDQNNYELIGSKPTSQSREISQWSWGLHAVLGGISTREIIVIVPALLGL